MKHSGQMQNRRKILADAARYSALGLLSAISGWSYVKRRRLVREGKCINRGICRGCRVYEKCGLPQALSAKQALSGIKHGRT
ncbi:MAG: hypothetical protein ACYTFK_07390 [Planctomycetota bacterium]|jgi:hypothetical protein